MGQILFLLPALAADVFAAMIALTAKEIRIPWPSRLIFALIGSLFVLGSMLGGAVFGTFLSANSCKAISFTVLFLLGIGSCFRSFMQIVLKKIENSVKQMRFHLFGLSFFLSICADETKADLDRSKVLNLPEAAALSTALSLDAIAAGLAGCFPAGAALLAGLFYFPLQLLVIWGGSLLGGNAARNLPENLPETLGGALMIILAFLRLI